MVHLHDLARQRQSQTVPGLLADIAVVGTEKLVEDQLLIGFRDAVALVTDDDLDAVIGLPGAERYATAGP